MSSDRVAVEPGLLVWARQALGLNEETAARRLGVSEATLAKWETGDLGPTIKQLRKAASTYRVPLAVLLLPDPPTTYQPIRDFRRFVDGVQPPMSPELHTELRRAQMQRDVFLELAELAPDSINATASLPNITLGTPPEEAGRLLRELSGISLQQQRAWKTPNEGLNGWIDAIEGRGLLVVHATRVSVDEARGFSISELPFPVIGLNGADWARPRIFTLFHELTHIALNLGGLCDLHETRRRQTADSDQFEHYCNLAAAAAIVPRDDLLSIESVARRNASYDWTLDEVASLADRYTISAEALLLRLITLEKASWDTYWDHKAELEDRYAEARADRKQRQKESEGGPSYYIVKARDIGHGYAHAVLDAYRTRAISALDVSDYLHVKYNQIPRLEKVLR